MAQRKFSNVVVVACTILSTLLFDGHSHCSGGDGKRQKNEPAKKEAVAPISKNVLSIADSNNQFACDLYHQLRDNEDNLFFSPVSITTLLMIAHGGAAGTTADEMAKTLHLELPFDEAHSAQRRMLESMVPPPANGKKLPQYQLQIANRVWAHQDFVIQDSYQRFLKNRYNSELTQLNFKRKDEVVATINNWVKESTNDRIETIVNPSMIDSYTCLILTNATYFNAKWAQQFKTEETTPHPFLSKANQGTEIPMMYQKSHFRFNHMMLNDGTKMKILAMKYQSSEFSMAILLPDEIDGLAAIEKQLTAKVLTDSLESLKSKEVLTWVPKFKLTTSLTDLIGPLQNLGMKTAFTLPQDQNRDLGANFSKINSQIPIYIQNIGHQTFVDVNEERTEAAAATSMGGGFGGMIANVPEPEIFCADHPFLFLIRDDRSGGILFLGRIRQLDGRKLTDDEIETFRKTGPKVQRSNPQGFGGGSF